MKKILLIFMIIISITLVGCGSMSDSKSESKAANHDMTEQKSEVAMDQENSSMENVNNAEAQDDDKKIKTADISVETEEYDSSENNLQDLIKRLNGYIQYSSSSKTYEGESKSSHYIIRIPEDKFDVFINDCKAVGTIVDETIGSEDVTMQHEDIEARIKVLKAQEARYVELMNATESMEDILKIEDHLSDIRYQIEKYTARLNSLDNKINYGTINFNLNEVEHIRKEETTFGSKIANAFKTSLISVKTFVLSLIVIIVFLIPYIIIGGIIAVLVIFIIRKRKGRIGKK